MRKRRAGRGQETGQWDATPTAVRDDATPGAAISREGASPAPEAELVAAHAARKGEAGGAGQELQPIEAKEVAEDNRIPLEQHQRLLAEFDNYRKRMEQQQGRASRWAKDELLGRLLPVIDDCERARQAILASPEGLDRDGVLIILGRLAETLKREGLDRIEASPGMVFDPEVHEAVLTIPSADFTAGSIAEVLEPGYRSGERLLRPAKVAVAVASGSNDAAPDAGDASG